MNKVIAIHGVPRSGTSWLAQIFNSNPNVKIKFQPLFSYALKNLIDEKASHDDIKMFYKKMWDNNQDDFLNLKDPVIHKNYPRFDKIENPDILVFKQVHHHYILNNLLCKDPDIKVILTIRNPLAVLSSWKNAPKEFHPSWNFDKQWRNGELKNQGMKENYFGFFKWKEATKLFLELSIKYPKQVYLLNYGDLLLNTLNSTLDMYKFIGIPRVDTQTRQFIEDSKKKNDKDPNSVYKFKKNDNNWKLALSPSIIQEVKQDDLFIFLNDKYKWLENEL